MIIRHLLREDIEAVYKIEQACFGVPWSKEALNQEIDNRLAFYLVVVLENRLAGYGGMHIILGEGEVTRIAVAPEYQRRGIGKVLFQHMLHEANKKLTHTITLEVRSSNEAAQALYTHEGFGVIASRKNYYQKPAEDALIMQLKIT